MPTDEQFYKRLYLKCNDQYHQARKTLDIAWLEALSGNIAQYCNYHTSNENKPFTDEFTLLYKLCLKTIEQIEEKRKKEGEAREEEQKRYIQEVKDCKPKRDTRGDGYAMEDDETGNIEIDYVREHNFERDNNL